MTLPTHHGSWLGWAPTDAAYELLKLRVEWPPSLYLANLSWRKSAAFGLCPLHWLISLMLLREVGSQVTHVSLYANVHLPRLLPRKTFQLMLLGGNMVRPLLTVPSTHTAPVFLPLGQRAADLRPDDRKSRALGTPAVG